MKAVESAELELLKKTDTAIMWLENVKIQLSTSHRLNNGILGLAHLNNEQSVKRSQCKDVIYQDLLDFEEDKTCLLHQLTTSGGFFKQPNT